MMQLAKTSLKNWESDTEPGLLDPINTKPISLESEEALELELLLEELAEIIESEDGVLIP